MAGFFNPNVAFDANKPQDYDYQAQAQRLAMQQALAQRLGQPLDQGRMVGGWYAGPSKGATIASALQQALGGWMAVKGMQGQQELDKADREAMAAARKLYKDASDPENYIGKAQEANPMLTHTYRDPSAVGPSMDELNGVQTFPVQDPNKRIVSRSLNDPNIPPMPVEPPPPPTFNVDQEAAKRIQGEQVKYLRREMANDRETALDRLSRTKSGAPLADALLKRDMTPEEYEYKTVKQGDNEVMVRVGKRSGQVSPVFGNEGAGGPSVAQQNAILAREKFDFEKTQAQREAEEKASVRGEKAVEKQRGVVEALASNDAALRKIELLLPKVGDTTGAGGMISNWFNKQTGIPTDSAIAREELESVKGTLMATAMRMSKEQSGSASGLSQVESEALAKSIASLDPRVGEKALTNQLNEVYRQFRQYGERLKDRADGAPASPATPAGPVPGYGFKVPARGQRVTSPEDYGF